MWVDSQAFQVSSLPNWSWLTLNLTLTLQMKKDGDDDQQEKCTICLSEFEMEEDVR